MSEIHLQRILHVDDQVEIRDIVRNELDIKGPYQVRSCSTGQEMLECVLDFAPHMVLLDFGMAGMRGPEAIKALQALDGFDQERIPVVFFATEAETVDINLFFRLGAADVITKPFDTTTLAEFIGDIWREYQAKRNA